jgi:hypothetical protein
LAKLGDSFLKASIKPFNEKDLGKSHIWDMDIFSNDLKLVIRVT